MRSFRALLGTAAITLITVPAGTVQGGFSGSDVFLPMAGRQAGVGVSGGAIAGTGVYGTSETGYGVHGESSTGDGVFGESSGTNKSGVYAVNTNAAGWAGFFAGRVGITATLECTGCVGKGALAATGGSAGQVLGTDGSGLAWQSGSGMTLPYSGQATTTGTVFDVSNWATGNSGQAIAGHFPQHGVHGVLGGHSVGVSGESMNGVGVRGESSTAAGVYGTSDYYGVFGISNSNNGVKGTTHTSGAAGVSGDNTSTGTEGYLGTQFAGVDGYGSPYGRTACSR